MAISENRLIDSSYSPRRPKTDMRLTNAHAHSRHADRKGARWWLVLCIW